MAVMTRPVAPFQELLTEKRIHSVKGESAAQPEVAVRNNAGSPRGVLSRCDGGQ